MLARISRGELPTKRHSALFRKDGSVYYEHCLTRDGFSGPFSVTYHQHRPQGFELAPSGRSFAVPDPAETGRLSRRHLRAAPPVPSGDSLDARVPLLFGPDVVVSWRAPTRSDQRYFQNADGDELLFIQQGKGLLVSSFGVLPFEESSYLYVPKGVLHRFEVKGAQGWLSLEFQERLTIPASFRNDLGQLRMDAPYSERDFAVPDFVGVSDEGIRDVLVKRDNSLSLARYPATPLDVVGFEGSVYPFRFPILAFQPRVSSVHLPPTAHATFATSNVLVCSFVPRPLDFGENAVPCPYPHSSVDIDEVLFYVAGDFTSRTGVGPGSLTWHPRGTPHGPQPGRYEASIGKRSTDEVAVMLDCRHPLSMTRAALDVEDTDYENSFR